MKRRVAIPLSVAEDTGKLRPPPLHHERAQYVGETMGTSWCVDLYAEQRAADWRRLIERELERLVAQMSNWREDSDVSRFGRANAGAWMNVPTELYRVIEAAVAASELTSGAFDPTVAPLVDNWGFGPAGRRQDAPPSHAEVSASLARRGAGRLKLDPQRQRIWQPGGVSLDLSSIGKGFAVDWLSEKLDVPEVSSCLVEIGGELRGRGLKRDGEPWWVAVEKPPGTERDENLPETFVALCGVAIATSGDYRRYFVYEGTRYSHTIDPRTGEPANGGVASATVVHEECMLADAYSTAIVVLGAEEGIAWANRHGVAALVLKREGTGGLEYITSRAFQQLLDD